MDAIGGGWLYSGKKHLFDCIHKDSVILRLKGSANRFEIAIAHLLLTPDVWRAVGFKRGWEEGAEVDMFNMFSAFLFEGLSIEDSLALINKNGY